MVRRVALCVIVSAFGIACRPATKPADPAKAAVDVGEPRVATVLRGRVHGHDDEPIAMAHVRVLLPGIAEPAVAAVGSDGRFELHAERQGLAMLEVTAIDHAQLHVPIILRPGATELTVRLGTYGRAADLSKMGLLVWTRDPDRSPPDRVPFTDAGDDTFVASKEVKSEHVQVQLEGFTDEGRTVNTPDATRWAYDGGGDYRSVLAAANGRVEVRVDPRKAVPGGIAATIAFADENAPAARLAAVHLRIAAHLRAREREAMQLMERDPAAIPAFMQSWDWTSARTDVLTALQRETDPLARRAMIAIELGLGDRKPESATPEERARAKEMLGEMPGDDAAWALFPSAMALAVRLSDDPAHRQRLEVLLRDELPAEVAAQMIIERLVTATAEGDVESARTWFAVIKSERFKSVPFARIANQFDPDRPVQAGKPVPAFSFGALPDAKGNVDRSITSEDLQGKVVLLDFWATWCKPCVADMPHLHAAYDRWGVGGTKGRKRKKGRKFEIVSVSVDASADPVHAFRKDKWPMPWQHALSPIGDASDKFGFTGIPFAVLVDDKGTILAATPQLSGATLDATLQQVLAE